MTTDFRALCAELVESVEVLLALRPAEARPLRTTEDRLSRARAALADEPAEPPLYARQTGIGQWEGADHPSGPWRKVLPADLARWGNPAPQPAAVTGQPNDEEWDALVERVWDKYETAGYQGERFMYDGDFGSALDLVRKELSRWGHQPAPPADGEVAELVAWLRERATWCTAEDPAHKKYDRAAELLQRQVLVPVPVSERLPGPEDCDSHGWCWVLYSAHSTWTLEPPYGQDGMPTGWTHWLPAHALPLPEVGE